MLTPEERDALQVKLDRFIDSLSDDNPLGDPTPLSDDELAAFRASVRSHSAFATVDELDERAESATRLWIRARFQGHPNAPLHEVLWEVFYDLHRTFAHRLPAEIEALAPGFGEPPRA